ITGTSNGTLEVDTNAALCIGGTASSTNATCDSGATPTTATTFPTNYTNANITLQTASWFDPNWSYRTKFSIDHTKVQSTDQTDFPILLDVTDAKFEYVCFFFFKQKTAYDIVFTSSDGTTR